MDPLKRLARLAALGRRTRQVLLLAGATGLLVGLLVAGFERLVREDMVETLRRQNHWLVAFCPLVGLVLAAACLKWVAAGSTPFTADEYIRNFHDNERRLDERPVAGRILASIATLGSGGAMGFEGPSIYMGAAVGSAIQRRLSPLFSRDDAKVLLVCGAAAGVAAIFKAPATGIVFALEVPYQDDLARRMLLPAAIAAAASYLVFVALAGTTPLLPVTGAAPFDLRDLGGAVVLGLLCGVGARVFVLVITRAKRAAAAGGPWVRAVGAGLVLAGLWWASYQLTGEGLTFGPGYNALRWALDPNRAVALVLGLFVLRALATVVTIGGGGAGGLFIPLVIEGALLGRAVGGLFDQSGTTLFPVLGIAAFLGAGYRVPLASVVFVAEFTGRPGFVVPGLVAAVVAQLVMGRASASPYQVRGRVGHLERRFTLPVTTALQTDLLTMPPDATVAEFVWQHLVGTRQTSVAVVDGTSYLGMVGLAELGAVPREDWETTPVTEIMRTDLPTGRVDWVLRDAVTAMETADVDRLPVLDASGCFVGVVTTDEILALDDILEQAGGE
jgi:CIC family chloride channel protein